MKNISIFFSSTFIDMQDERDVLVTNVLPALRERLYLLDTRLIDIDLRWGVLEYENDTKKETNKWHYCKKGIDQAKEYFICMLGNRYGQKQKHEDFESTDFGKLSKVTLEDCIDKSLTDIEIRYATENFTSNEFRRSLFFLKQIDSTSASVEASSLLQNAATKDQLLALNELKASVKEFGKAFDVPVVPYPVKIDNQGNAESLDEFAEIIKEELWLAIFFDHILPVLTSHNIPHTLLSRNEYQGVLPEEVWRSLINALLVKVGKGISPLEKIQISSFIKDKTDLFLGRKYELKLLNQYIKNGHEKPCVLLGEPGMGKTTLMAKFNRKLLKNKSQQTVVLSRYVGIGDESGTLDTFLSGLTRELSYYTQLNDDTSGQEVLFNQQLSKWPSLQEGKEEPVRLILMIDAVNQIPDQKSLSWIPSQLPEGVRVILSTTDYPEGVDAEIVDLAPMKKGETKDFINNYLNLYAKSLSNNQIKEILKLKNHGNPLYITVLLNELRTEHTVTDDEGRLEELSEIEGETYLSEEITQIKEIDDKYPTTELLFDWVLTKCERFFGQLNSKLWFSYLAVSKTGASSEELAVLVARGSDNNSTKSGYIIERYIRRYIMQYGKLLLPYHSQFLNAIVHRYIDDLEGYGLQELHKQWADLLDKRWQMKDHHALNALPYHLSEAKEEELYDLAENEEFLKVQQEVSGSIVWSESTVNKALKLAIEQEDAQKSISFLASPYHLKARDTEFTPLQAFKDYNLEYALSVADTYSAKQVPYWYILIAWKLTVMEQHNQVSFVLTELLKKSNVVLTSGAVAWVVPNEVNRWGDKYQDRHQWICEALVAMIEHHPELVMAVIGLNDDPVLLRLMVEELAKNGLKEQAGSLLTEVTKDSIDYIEMKVSIWKYSEASAPSPTLPELLNLIAKLDGMAMSIAKIRLAHILIGKNEVAKSSELISEIDCQPNNTDTSQNVDVPLLAKKITGFSWALQFIHGLKNEENNHYIIEVVQSLVDLYDLRPNIQPETDDWPSDHRYEQNFEYYQAHKAIIYDGLEVIKLLYKLNLVKEAQQIFKTLPGFIPKETVNYLSLKGRIEAEGKSIDDQQFAIWFKEASTIQNTYVLSAAVFLLVPFVKDKAYQTYFTKLATRVEPKNHKTDFDLRSFLYFQGEKAQLLANHDQLEEALNIAFGLQYAQWRDEFNLSDPNRYNDILDRNGYYFLILRKLSYALAQQEKWDEIAQIATYFDQNYRGQWIIYDAAEIAAKPSKRIALIENAMTFENKGTYYPMSVKSIADLSDIGNFTPMNELIKKEAEVYPFLEWIIKKLHGKSYVKEIIGDVRNYLMDLLSFRKSKIGGIGTWWMTICMILLVYLLTTAIQSSITSIINDPANFNSWGMLFYTIGIFLAIFLLVKKLFGGHVKKTFTSQLIEISSHLKHLKINYTDLADTRPFNTKKFLEISRIKTPGRSRTVDHQMTRHFNFNIDDRHPKRVFIDSMINLAYMALKEKNSAALQYALDRLLSYQGETFTDYYQMTGAGYSHPAHGVGIDTGNFGDYDSLIVSLIEILGNERRFGQAFSCIEQLQKPESKDWGREVLAKVRALQNDYWGIRWAFSTPIKDYTPSEDRYADYSYMDGSLSSINTGIYRIIEQLLWDKEHELAFSLIQQEEEGELKSTLLDRYNEIKRAQSNPKPKSHTEEDKFWDDYEFRSGPFGHFTYDLGYEGKINSTCLEIRNAINEKRYDDVFALIDPVQDREIRASLRFLYFTVVEDRPTHEKEKLIMDLDLPFEESDLIHKTAIFALLEEKMPHYSRWYKNGTRWRWEFLCCKVLSWASAPDDLEKQRLEVMSQFKYLTIRTEVFCEWAKKYILDNQATKGIRLLLSLEPNESYIYIPSILHAFAQTDGSTDQLIAVLRYCQTHPKLLSTAIEGLSIYFGNSKLEETIVGLDLESKRLDLYSELKSEEINPSELKQLDFDLFLGVSRQLIDKNDLKQAAKYLSKSNSLLHELEGTQDYTSNVISVKSEWASVFERCGYYTRAIEVSEEIELTNEVHQARHHKRLARLYHDKFIYESQQIQDLRIAVSHCASLWKYLYSSRNYALTPLERDDMKDYLNCLTGRIAYQLNLKSRSVVLLINGIFRKLDRYPFLHLVAELMVENGDYQEALQMVKYDRQNFSYHTLVAYMHLQVLFYLKDYEGMLEVLKSVTDEPAKAPFQQILQFFHILALDGLGQPVFELLNNLQDEILGVKAREFEQSQCNWAFLHDYLQNNLDADNPPTEKIINISTQLLEFCLPGRILNVDRAEALDIFKPLDEMVDYKAMTDLIKASEGVPLGSFDA